MPFAPRSTVSLVWRTLMVSWPLSMAFAESAANDTNLRFHLEISRDARFVLVNGNEFNCTKLVKFKDISPKRSPQIVHTLLAWYFQGKDVLEAGTRIGDGLDCWARATNRTIGMEIDNGYCKAMIARAKSAGYQQKLTMLCRSFFDDTPDADIYTFWAQPPHMKVTGSLEHLARLHLQGKVRPKAEAVVLFEKGAPGDDLEYAKTAHDYAAWSALVHFDEHATCSAWPIRASKLRREQLCNRARGHFHVAAFPLHRIAANLNSTGQISPKPYVTALGPWVRDPRV